MDLNIDEIGNETVQLSDGSHCRLRRFWQPGPLVMVFLRHYG